MNPLILEIKTVPIELDNFLTLEEDERQKKINPIDSKICAIGIKTEQKELLLTGDEKEILKEFWQTIKEHKISHKIVGLNIRNFDIPFITTRSFINNISIEPFTLKDLIDLKEQINAFRYGKTRGKLTEYAKILNITTTKPENEDIPQLYKNNNIETIKNYLKEDLIVNLEIFKRAEQTNINKITRW